MPAIAEAILFAMHRDECKRHGKAALRLFTKLTKEGNPSGFASMLAIQQFPGTKNTDRTFQEGQRRKMENMDPVNRAKILKIAKASGIQTGGKYYVGGLGRASDPNAWVATADDLIAVCKKTNSSVEGAVTFRGRQTETPPGRRRGLAPDIAKELMQRKCQADPALAERVRRGGKKAVQALKEQVNAEHGPKNRE
jgi:hypothetical protein